MTVVPQAIAEILFKPFGPSRRHQPIPARVFRCIARIGEQSYDCALYLTDFGPVELGDTAIVPMDFLCPDLVAHELNVCVKFQLYDGNDPLGEGKVISLHLDLAKLHFEKRKQQLAADS